MEIRNIAIIAHVDHGKTTLTDAFMRLTGMSSGQASMDSNALEQERGITIYSKNTSVFYGGSRINIVDTPGHPDFGSEVERILRSVDSVLLLVDAKEGPMPQTKFVLKKSLELGLKPLVVINKIDRPGARPREVEDMVFELFIELGADDRQLDFKTVFSSARDGAAKLSPEAGDSGLELILDSVLSEVPPAADEHALALPFVAQPFNLAYDNFLGRCAVCRVYAGQVKSSQQVYVRGLDGAVRAGKISRVFTFRGVRREEASFARAGDIVMLAGLPDIYIGETIAGNPEQAPLPAIKIDEPTISLNFLVNNSPFAGREGRFVTNRQLRERLKKELEVDVGLRIDFDDRHYFRVRGRGELHIAILLENLRREGYELQVSRPEVIIKEKDGERLEPFEEMTVDIPGSLTGAVMEKIADRRGRLLHMENENGQSRLVFEIPTRGLLGYLREFIVDTRGEGSYFSRFIDFRPYAGEVVKSRLGAMVSMFTGKALAYALWNLQERGSLYIGPNTAVYEGMVIGNVSKGSDMAVNPVKGKQLTNMRAAGADDAIKLTPPVPLTLETGFSVMNEDEYLEVTPAAIRLRKQLLTESERVRAGRAGRG